MIPRINIYLTQEDKEELQKKQNKYRASFSTIADVLIFITYKTLLHYGTTENLNQVLQTEYFKKGSKTSIKCPRCLRENKLMPNLIGNNASKYISNALHLYASKNIKLYVDTYGLSYYHNEIDKELSKVQDKFYNYNNFVRNSRRNLKENKDYYKRAIDQMEHNNQ